MLDGAGNATILARSVPSSASSSYTDNLWTLDGAGVTLVSESVLSASELTTDVPPSLVPNAFGETRIAYPRTGAALHRLAWQIWPTLGGVVNFVDVRVGTDRVPRYLVPSTTTSAKIYDLAEPICHPSCQQNECGPDGCGGNCGVCANCVGCGEDGHCAIPPSERVAPQPGGGPGYPAVQAAALMPDGRLTVIPSYGAGALSQIGTTGHWAAGPTVPSPLYSGGGQLYAVASYGAVYRWDGTDYRSVANLGLPVFAASAAVDAAGQVHLAYVMPYAPPTSGTNTQSIYHVRIAPDGTVGPTETVYTAPSISYNLGTPGIAAGAADVVHITYNQTKYDVSSGAQLPESSRDATRTGGVAWTETLSPSSYTFGSGQVDAQGTLWIAVVPPSASSSAGYGYAVRTAAGQWTFPAFNGTAFTTQPASAGTFTKLADGQIVTFTGFSAATPTFHRLDTAANRWQSWFQAPRNLGSVWVFDQQGVLHIFGLENPNNVFQLRQWWMTPPP